MARTAARPARSTAATASSTTPSLTQTPWRGARVFWAWISKHWWGTLAWNAAPSASPARTGMLSKSSHRARLRYSLPSSTAQTVCCDDVTFGGTLHLLPFLLPQYAYACVSSRWQGCRWLHTRQPQRPLDVLGGPRSWTFVQNGLNSVVATLLTPVFLLA